MVSIDTTFEVPSWIAGATVILAILVAVMVIVTGGWVLDTDSQGKPSDPELTTNQSESSGGPNPPSIVGTVQRADQGPGDGLRGYDPQANTTVYLFNSSGEQHFSAIANQQSAIELGLYAPATGYEVTNDGFLSAVEINATTDGDGSFAAEVPTEATVACFPDGHTAAYDCFKLTGSSINVTARLIPQTSRYRLDVASGSQRSYFRVRITGE